jgi:RimJ/RimL family protein N-acetyltransferase
VNEFRDEDRVAEYRDKLAHREIGFFCELDGNAVGSIWASINESEVRKIVRMYMPLMPKDALIHDVVTGERCRGMGIGPFMVGALASILLNEYGVSRVIIDVNVKNVPSLRMMEKVGLQIKERVLYISAFGTLVGEKLLKRYV